MYDDNRVRRQKRVCVCGKGWNVIYRALSAGGAREGGAATAPFNPVSLAPTARILLPKRTGNRPTLCAIDPDKPMWWRCGYVGVGVCGVEGSGGERGGGAQALQLQPRKQRLDQKG